MIVYNYDADLEVSDTCVRSSLLSWVELHRPWPRRCLWRRPIFWEPFELLQEDHTPTWCKQQQQQQQQQILCVKFAILDTVFRHFCLSFFPANSLHSFQPTSSMRSVFLAKLSMKFVNYCREVITNKCIWHLLFKSKFKCQCVVRIIYSSVFVCWRGTFIYSMSMTRKGKLLCFCWSEFWSVFLSFFMVFNVLFLFLTHHFGTVLFMASCYNRQP